MAPAESFLSQLDWLRDTGHAEADDRGLLLRARPATDWFNDPDSGTRVSSAPVLCAPVVEDCQVSARVTVEFESAFDAGMLFVHQTDDDYAKLCFERSPQGENMVVSVVTRGVSDDSNGSVIGANSVHLRVSKYRNVIAFHWSADGQSWSLLRYFQLREPAASTSVGFAAQSPTGQGCTATFANIVYRAAAPSDIRDGS